MEELHLDILMFMARVKKIKARWHRLLIKMSVLHSEGKNINLFPKNPRRDFVYVKDIVSSNIHAMENYSLLEGRYYEVGSGVARPFEDVMEIMGIPYGYLDQSVIPQGYQFYTCSNPKKMDVRLDFPMVFGRRTKRLF